jgi:hypothetical protein
VPGSSPRAGATFSLRPAPFRSLRYRMALPALSPSLLFLLLLLLLLQVLLGL